MVGATPDWAWGHWVLGDLADALRRASDAVGHDIDVLRVQVMPPGTPGDLPEVTMVLGDDRGVSRLQREVRDGGYPVFWPDVEVENGWMVEILGLRLVVVTEAGEPR